ncbi:ester cyclase [Streptomyces sp. NPDC021096]|uniref:ester cyclase n=1 Tax=Streptomyces sp. NPDC021096 TaxID=3154792 RepID=UPI0034106DC6
MRYKTPLIACSVASMILLTGATAAPATQHGHKGDPTRLIDRTPGLVRPLSLTVDGSLSERRARQEVRLAQLLYTFWNTGRTQYLDAAVSADFQDNTLPAGRPQGPAGPAFASKNFRAVVPDLTCELSDLLITGDKITARLVFRGHFTGTFNGVQGKGQKVDFNAIDIQHVGKNKITEDWHIEDNQTLLSQLGVTR